MMTADGSCAHPDGCVLPGPGCERGCAVRETGVCPDYAPAPHPLEVLGVTETGARLLAEALGGDVVQGGHR